MDYVTEVGKEEILDIFKAGILVKLADKFLGIGPGSQIVIEDERFTVSGVLHGRGRVLLNLSS